jgi:hypothetical protein
MATTNTCACGASFATPAQLEKHAQTCGQSREPGGDPVA